VYPELITIGSFTITTFGLMMALAFLSGYFVIHLELKRQGADPDLAADILLGALIGGILGAKIYYVLLYWDRTALDPVGMLTAREGLVWYGGLIGGTLGAILMLRRRKASIAFGADLVAPALSIGYAVGRLGCFGVGDDYGKPTDSWVGIKFPQGAPPTTAGNLRRWGAEVDPAIPDAEVLAVHPTQLYETAMALVIFAVLWKLRTRPRAQGSLFALWMVLAGVERLIVEVFRAKDDRFFGPFTLAQVISVVLIAGGIYILYRLGKSRPAEAASG
jgi:phosphatidylglycerol:prolipoprotein diacylglycerol transferase